MGVGVGVGLTLGVGVDIGLDIGVGVLTGPVAVGDAAGRPCAWGVTVGAGVDVGAAQPAPRRTVPMMSVISDAL